MMKAIRQPYTSSLAGRSERIARLTPVATATPLVTQANVGMYVTPQEKLKKGPMKVSFVKQGALWAVKAS